MADDESETTDSLAIVIEHSSRHTCKIEARRGEKQLSKQVEESQLVTK